METIQHERQKHVKCLCQTDTSSGEQIQHREKGKKNQKKLPIPKNAKAGRKMKEIKNFHLRMVKV